MTSYLGGLYGEQYSGVRISGEWRRVVEGCCAAVLIFFNRSVSSDTSLCGGGGMGRGLSINSSVTGGGGGGQLSSSFVGNVNVLACAAGGKGGD